MNVIARLELELAYYDFLVRRFNHYTTSTFPDWAVIDPLTEWSMTCNTRLWFLLGLTGGSDRPDPINRLVSSYPSTCLFIFSWTYDPIYSCRTIPKTLFSPVDWVCKTPQRVSRIYHLTIWWWGSSNAGDLRNADCPFIAIAPMSTLVRSGSIW